MGMTVPRPLHAYEIERNALAARVGTNLPTPRKLKLRMPGFALGSCGRLHFTPSGTHLIAVTANGTHLWDVATGERCLKLTVPNNPSEVAFSVDGAQALIRNEQGQFVRLSMPDGVVLSKFKAKHPWRLEGTPGVGPDDRVLQLAYGGRLLELDSNNGRGRCVPCALWRWDDKASAPRRLLGEWDQLNAARAPGGEGLLLHHVFEAGPSPRAAIERFDVSTGATTPIGEAPMSIISLPSLAHDGKAFGVAGDDGPHINIGGEVLTLPGRAYVQFHPTMDLVGISGSAAFVAPRAALAQQLPDLQVWQQERELSGRGFSRLSTLGGSVPARLIVFARENEWLVQAERIEGKKYAPLAEPIPVSEGGEAAARDAMAAMLSIARAGTYADEPATGGERRSFHGGTITPPGPGWSSGVAVAFADDAIDVWPLKPSGTVAFSHDCYPVAALAPDASAGEIISAVRIMLAWFKPRRR
jgi:hypothetical protein